jgi:hypothetical protein
MSQLACCQKLRVTATILGKRPRDGFQLCDIERQRSGEAVPKCVAAGFQATAARLGSGAAFRIGAISRYLLLGGHGYALVSAVDLASVFISLLCH